MRVILGVSIMMGLICGSQQRADADVSIIDVRRNIPLSDDSDVYRDYYLNGSEGAGLKKDLVVTVSRKLQIRDSSGSNSFGEILVPVGQIKIIATYGLVSVAREYKFLGRENLPMLEQIGIMVGDHIDLRGSYVDSSPFKATKKMVKPASVPVEKPQVSNAAEPAKTEIKK